jgi:hypothetical protein
MIASIRDDCAAEAACRHRSSASDCSSGTTACGGSGCLEARRNQATVSAARWRIGTASDVAWLAGQTTNGLSITTAIPPVFDAYATFYPPDGVSFEAHERAVVDELTEHTPDQPWWLGYLDTGAHDIVFPLAPRGRGRSQEPASHPGSNHRRR